MSDSEFEVHHPEVRVRLSGLDGNVFVLIGAVTRGLRRAGISSAEIDRFVGEVTSAGSYDAALQVMSRWVTTS